MSYIHTRRETISIFIELVRKMDQKNGWTKKMIENFALFIIRYRGIDISAYSLVSFSQGLSAMVQYFPLRTNQHQPGLSAQKPTSEQADRLKCFLAFYCAYRSEPYKQVDCFVGL